MPNLSMGVSASATAPALSAFRAAHPDVTVWSAVDFDVYEHLVETANVRPAPTAAQVEAALSRLLKAVPYLEADSEFNYVVGYDLARDAA